MAVEGRGVLYIGHLPDGMEEPELKSYFKQFGSVTRLRLSRSIKTGGSKGYGFVEFSSKEVASIAAESMNGYLMFNKVLQCRVVPPEEIHPSLFKGCSKRFRPSRKWKKSVISNNKDRDPSKCVKAADRVRKRVQTRLQALKDMGLNPPEPCVGESCCNLADETDLKSTKAEPMKKKKGSTKNKGK